MYNPLGFQRQTPTRRACGGGLQGGKGYKLSLKFCVSRGLNLAMPKHFQLLFFEFPLNILRAFIPYCSSILVIQNLPRRERERTCICVPLLMHAWEEFKAQASRNTRIPYNTKRARVIYTENFVQSFCKTNQCWLRVFTGDCGSIQMSEIFKLLWNGCFLCWK